MGRLVSVVYETEKGGDGFSEYEHEFDSPLALLCYGSDDGRLYIVGGGYHVSWRGIVH